AGVSQEWLGGVKKGAAYVGINIKDLRMLPVHAPKMEQQSAVVQRLDAFHAETQRLQSIYQDTTDRSHSHTSACVGFMEVVGPNGVVGLAE
ncbi:MAG: hypothetical protein GY948_16435, partial [Alphaproteobacteria bacterium]|nr:hypothetical protein [Alphaproteobacteria bacterium]